MKQVLTYLCIAVIAISVMGQETVDRIIVVVDDNIILESEVLQFAQSLAIQNRVDPIRYIQNEEIRSQILNQLIDQKVLLAKAKEDTNIFVEDREVKREMDNRLEMMMAEVGSEAELEKVYGKPLRDIKREFEKTIYEGLMVDKLRQSKIMGIRVSRAEIEEFYGKNADRMSSNPESVDLSHLLLNIEPSADAESGAKGLIDSLKQAVLGGSNFSELAQQFSQDPGSGKKGGKLGWTKRGDFVPAFEEAAFNLETGQVSEPVKTQFGYHIIKLNDRQGEKINTSHILIKLAPT
ncbi:MAG: peptidylprolyl isomerase, partial [FCB group bacterium]|nr:peptidylprolyl isomerase [FCB group bacterium]